MSTTHQPLRTCVGCGSKDLRDNLLRLVLDAATQCVVVDETKSAPGRGAWLHPVPECGALAVRKSALCRAFRNSRVSAVAVINYLGSEVSKY